MASELDLLKSELDQALAADSTQEYKTKSVGRLFRQLVRMKDPGVPALVVDILHGNKGTLAAESAWQNISAGFVMPNGKGSSELSVGFRFSLTTLCLAHANIGTLQAIVDAGPPSTVPAAIKPRNQSEWLDLLSTTLMAMATEKVQKVTQPGYVSLGAVGEIATYYDVYPAAGEALELVWRMDPDHPGFSALVEEDSSQGAFVRALLMRKSIAKAEDGLVADKPAMQADPASPRRRRRADV